MKQAIIVTLVVVGIITGAVLLSDSSETAVGAESNNFYGQEEGIVTITEYGDFQCPACANFFPIVTEVKEELMDEVRFEFKHFPLISIHPNAMAAHRAAQAAANQGQFWEMHDLIYARQQLWTSSNNPTDIFDEYAVELGLDIEQYRAEVGSGEVLGVINADIEKGRDLGANSTPTFFIDGELVDDLGSIATVDEFVQVVRDRIADKSPQAETTDTPEQEESTEPEEAATE